MRLKDKYHLGNDKYLLHISSANWHNKKPIDSNKRLKLLFIDRIVIAKTEGVTDQIVIKNLICLSKGLFRGRFNMTPQYIAPRNVKIIDP